MHCGYRLLQSSLETVGLCQRRVMHELAFDIVLPLAEQRTQRRNETV